MTALRDSPGQAVISRFAPSPTGPLHLGHALSAIIAHDVAVAAGGIFLVRIEDLDARARAHWADGIVADLAWLGLRHATPLLHQSTRGAAYADALASLRERGLTYRCTCTRAEVAASVSAPHGDLPPQYPRMCRASPPAPDDPRPACVRLDMARALASAGPVTWAGASVDPAPWGDVVLARKGGGASYHLAVVVDDAAQGVSDVVRGRDLAIATPLQRLLQVLLGLPEPRYHHHPLVCDSSGKRLAKRDAAASLTSLRAKHRDGLALAAMLRAGELPVGYCRRAS